MSRVKVVKAPVSKKQHLGTKTGKYSGTTALPSVAFQDFNFDWGKKLRTIIPKFSASGIVFQNPLIRPFKYPV